MELLTIRESSLGSYTQALQDAILQGYRMSDESSKYPWIDQQYNAVLELKPLVEISVEPVQDELEPAQEEQNLTEQPNKPSAGRPRRKL